MQAKHAEAGETKTDTIIQYRERGPTGKFLPGNKAKSKAAKKREGPKPPDKVTPHPRVGDEVDKYGPRNLDFEDKLGAVGAKPQPKQPRPETKAPPKEDQSQLEIKMIADFLKLPFTFWAARIKFPAVRLTDNEAREWAEPTRTLLDHYMPLIPPIGYAWIAWGITTITIMDKRLELIAAEKTKRTKQEPAPVQAPTTGHSADPRAQQQGAPQYKPQKG